MRDIAIAIPPSDLERAIRQAAGEFEPLDLSQVTRDPLNIGERTGR